MKNLLGKLPLYFEPNVGQADGQVRYLSHGRGYGLFLTGSDAVLVLRRGQSAKADAVDRKHARRAGDEDWREDVGEGEAAVCTSHLEGGPDAHVAAAARASAQAREADPERASSAVLRMRMVGARESAGVTGEAELSGKVNYFIGNDPSRWRKGIPTYEKVRYQEVYPGIDLVYYGNEGKLEHDFVIAAGADPAAIELAFDGADGMRVDTPGDLILDVEGGEVRLRTPVIYQEAGGKREEVRGRYVMRGESRVGFEVAAYDQSKSLVIDPVLVYSTYLGGSDEDRGKDIAVDAAGNAYITGYTYSSDFPLTSPLQGAQAGYSDVFVTKIDATGSGLVYSTYLGEALVTLAPASRRTARGTLM